MLKQSLGNIIIVYDYISRYVNLVKGIPFDVIGTSLNDPRESLRHQGKLIQHKSA